MVSEEKIKKSQWWWGYQTSEHQIDSWSVGETFVVVNEFIGFIKTWVLQITNASNSENRKEESNTLFRVCHPAMIKATSGNIIHRRGRMAAWWGAGRYIQRNSFLRREPGFFLSEEGPFDVNSSGLPTCQAPHRSPPIQPSQPLREVDTLIIPFKLGKLRHKAV